MQADTNLLDSWRQNTDLSTHQAHTQCVIHTLHQLTRQTSHMSRQHNVLNRNTSMAHSAYVHKMSITRWNFGHFTTLTSTHNLLTLWTTKPGVIWCTKMYIFVTKISNISTNRQTDRQTDRHSPAVYTVLVGLLLHLDTSVAASWCPDDTQIYIHPVYTRQPLTLPKNTACNRIVATLAAISENSLKTVVTVLSHSVLLCCKHGISWQSQLKAALKDFVEAVLVHTGCRC